MKFRKIATVGVAASLLAGGVGLAGTASAEPVTNGYALTGSDTLQDSVNALVNGTVITGSSVRVLDADGIALGNFDAFGSPRIQTKPFKGFFTRPSGSGAGVTALRQSARGDVVSGTEMAGLVDIARSSSGPGTNADPNGKYVYIPYARDAVSYAYRAASPAAATVLSALTFDQLVGIYTASAPTTISGVTITPRLPQSSSGTRGFFLQTLGGGTAITPGTAVPAGDNQSTGPAENDASVLGDNQIIPFSAASWIAQFNGAAPSTIGATGVQLGAPDGVVPFTGTTTLAPRSEFYNGQFGRDTYLVVEYLRITQGTRGPNDPPYDAKLATLVDRTAGVNSLTSFSTTLPTQPGRVKQAFGFLAPSSVTPIRAYAAL